MLARVISFAIGIIGLALIGPKMMAAVDAEIAYREAIKSVDAISEPAKPVRPLDDDTHRVALRAGPGGHVIVDAVVNGRSVQMMVDTGATLVALSSNTAKRLGINPAKSGYTMMMSTANGVAPAAPVTLSEVWVGRIRVRNVEAVVVPGDALGIDLLGMSFLNKLHKFELGGGQLVLVQ